MVETISPRQAENKQLQARTTRTRIQKQRGWMVLQQRTRMWLRRILRRNLRE
jgi:hypothetical protein